MRTGSIYIIRNTVNDKVYVGQTTMTVRERFMVHMKPSNEKRKRTYKLYDAVHKYGRDCFYVETLEENVPLDELNQKEIEYIDKFDSYKNGYNSTPGGDGRVFNKVDDENALLEMANIGYSCEQLAAHFHVHKATIFRTLHRIGFYFRVPDSEIIALVNSGLNNKEIGARLGCHPATVTRALQRADARKHRVPIKNRNDLDISALKAEYEKQVPIGKLCEAFNISKTTFYRLKEKYDFDTRPQIYKYKIRYHTK